MPRGIPVGTATREELAAAADGALTRAEVLRRLGWSSNPARKKLEALAAELSVPIPGTNPVDTARRRTVPFYDEKLLREAVEGALTQTEALRRLGYQRPVHQYKQLREALMRFGIEAPWDSRPSSGHAGAGHADAPAGDKAPARTPRGAFANEDAVRSAVTGAANATAALAALGVQSTGRNYEALEKACGRLGIAAPPRRRITRAAKPPPRPLKHPFDVPSAVRAACDGARDRYEILHRLGLTATATTHERLNIAAARYGIELPPRPGRGHRPSVERRCPPGSDQTSKSVVLLDDEARKQLIERLFVAGTRFVATSTLRTNLAKLGIHPDACAVCSRPNVWVGAPLVLHLDHENGDCCDNRLENLRYVCPNCHAQTHTFAGRNRSRGHQRVKMPGTPAEVTDARDRVSIISKYFQPDAARNISTTTLKRNLAKLGILPTHCACCGSPPMWELKPLVLQLDHVNGVRTDNRLTNLRFLCPNCHSQTDTYAGRNRRRPDLTPAS